MEFNTTALYTENITLEELRQRMELTEGFLLCISNHLSGREDCRKQEYKVVIMNKLIGCNVPIRICKSNSERKDSDKQPIIVHILQEHFPELIDKSSTCNYQTILENMLVPGTYKYQLSSTKKQRKWVWVKESL